MLSFFVKLVSNFRCAYNSIFTTLGLYLKYCLHQFRNCEIYTIDYISAFYILVNAWKSWNQHRISDLWSVDARIEPLAAVLRLAGSIPAQNNYLNGLSPGSYSGSGWRYRKQNLVWLKDKKKQLINREYKLMISGNNDPVTTSFYWW